MYRLVAMATMVLASWISICGAESYPGKPVRFLVGYAPGGSADVVARALTSQLQRQLGVTMVVDNRAGAGGVIAYDLAAKAEPDGYTLLVISSSFVTSVAISNKLPFSYRKDFTPVSQFAQGPANVLVVNASFPGTALRDLLSLARARSTTVTYGSPGIGSVQNFVAELFNMRAGVKLLHVPYKGQAPALTALIGNEIQVAFLQPPGGVDLIKNGRLKALAYAGAARWPVMPNLPTVAESGVPDYQLKGPFEGILAPPSLPKSIVTRLNAEIGKALEGAQLKEFFTASGWEPEAHGADAFRDLLVSEVNRYSEIARVAGIKAD
jgi:tripartite-type tricarboxylate transporter receptor subunit TctC